MSFFCTLATLSGTQVLGTQYASVELYTVGNPPPLTLSDALTVCKSVNTAFDVVNGAFAYSSDVNSIQTLLDTYFTFDPDIFQTILGENLAAFALGLSIGAVIKLLKKT
jgi:hypothetical protein